MSTSTVLRAVALVLVALLACVSAGTTPLAVTCEAPKEKYYSIANNGGNPWECGECCLKPSKYPIFHLFEKNMTKAVTNTPCADRGYTLYSETARHGFGPLSLDVDLYKCTKESGCPHPEKKKF